MHNQNRDTWAYMSPRLTVYGTMASITLTSNGMNMSDSGGMGTLKT